MLDGQRLRRLREAHGYSRREMAEKVGVAEMQIIRYETGKNDATGAVLARIAGVFGVSTDYLLGITDIPAPNMDTTLRPEEVALLAAWRRGDYREVIKLLAPAE
jgi:transcriptional regulator with XRE-family HTH domain